MEENNAINGTNWALIEEMAQKLCPDEFELSSRSDLDFIEQQIVEGKVISFKDEGGDMHSYELYIITLQLVVATLHLVYDYYKSRKKQGLIVKDVVGLFLEEIGELSTKPSDDMITFLTRRRNEINQALDSIENKEIQTKEDDKP